MCCGVVVLVVVVGFVIVVDGIVICVDLSVSRYSFSNLTTLRHAGAGPCHAGGFAVDGRHLTVRNHSIAPCKQQHCGSRETFIKVQRGMPWHQLAPPPTITHLPSLYILQLPCGKREG